MTDTAEVLASYKGAIGFTPHTSPRSLRRPQIAALHSIVGYQSSGLQDPAIIVMPTGTGKTETMLSWFVATQPEKVLLLVPSSALRQQIGDKFETLGILQELGIVSPEAKHPRVARLEHRISGMDEARALVAATNIIIATPPALQASSPEVRETLYSACTHLVVDEAHHAPASTWSEVITAFKDRPVLLFTATPFRLDARPIPGRVVFRFPLRAAQQEGYFSSIDYNAILAFEDSDEVLAEKSLARLDADLAAGFQHQMLVRAANKTRAREILGIYQRRAPRHNPVLLVDDLSPTQRKRATAAMHDGRSRVVVCVDMLGEGFDLPTLKIGSFHDAPKSLSPLIQLVGRLARTASSAPLGKASVFVRQEPKQALSPLRSLLREDSDWDKVLDDVTERVTSQAEQTNAFDASFTGSPLDVPTALIEPKMSALAYPAAVDDWNPLAALAIYGEAVMGGSVSISGDGDTAWFVLEETADLRWGRIPSLHSTAFTLVLLHLDRASGLMYLHGSDTKRKYHDLAKGVIGQEVQPLSGYLTFRVFGELDRVVPSNIGLIDARDRDRRFSMHVGSDVEQALTEAERTHKANTHIAARAFDNGESVTVSASLSGRFWSMRTANGLDDWRTWCREQGAKLKNSKIDVRSLFRSMIIPQDVTERPPHPLLAMEWPWELYIGNGTGLLLAKDDSSPAGFLITDATLRVDDFGDFGPLRFSVVTPTWEVAYEAVVGATGIHYRAQNQTEAFVENRRGGSSPLSIWLNDNKPTLLFSGDRVVTGDDRLLAPREEVEPYPRDQLLALDWLAGGVNLRTESQGPDRRADSVQAYISKYLRSQQAFDVLLDDDGSGEAADLVGLRIDRDDLVITLVHCKYSAKSTPGARLSDIYEVCGQAMRGARWRDGGALPLLVHLDRRVAAYIRRTGKSPFDTGDREALYRIRERAPLLRPRLNTIVAQPGVSLAAVSDEQLRVLAGAAAYVQTVTKGAFRFYGSP